MAILSRIRVLPQQRLDLEDVSALLSAARTDAKLYTKQFITDANFILKGFTVSGLGLPNAMVAMADATFVIPENSTDFSWFTSAPAELDIVVPSAELTDNTRNYLELRVVTEINTPVTRAFWDPEANDGLGSEFNQVTDTITDLKVEVIVLTGGFSGSVDRIPIAVLDVNNAGNITSILDRRNLLFRLARPSNLGFNYPWGTKVEPIYTMTLTGGAGTYVAGETLTLGTETATVITGGTTTITFNSPSGINFFPGDTATGGTSGASRTIATVLESFTGVDKNVSNYKEMFDALMTEIKGMKGTAYWWQDAPFSLSGIAKFVESTLVQAVIGSSFLWNGSVLSIKDTSIGSPTNADVLAYIRVMGRSGNLSLTRQDGTGGSTTLAIANGSVLFVKIPATGSRTYSDSGVGDTNYQTTPIASYVSSDQNYWLAYREGARLYVRGYGEMESGEDIKIGDPELEDVLAQIDRLNSDVRENASAYFSSEEPVTWTGTELQFTQDIVLNVIASLDGTLSTHVIDVTDSPIALNDGESAWVEIDRENSGEILTVFFSDTDPIPAFSQADRDVIVLATRQDTAASLSLLYLPLHKQVIQPGQTIYLGSSGSGSDDSSAAQSPIPGYQWLEIDTFDDLPTSADAKVTTTSYTNASFNIADTLYRILCDKSKTVSTNSGTALTISGAPGFTVAVGDIVYITSGARSGQWRRIATVTTQTSYVLDSAFTGGNASGGDTLMVSQAVWTKDLVNLGSSTEKTRARDQFSGNILEIAVDYQDSLVVGDDIPDFVDKARVVVSASNSGAVADVGVPLSNTFTDIFERPQAPDQIDNYTLATNATQERLHLIFFANPDNVSVTTTANLLEYEASFYEEEDFVNGGVLESAYCYSDGSGTEINCEPATVVSGKTQVELDWSYIPTVNTGETQGQLTVVVDGMVLPRFVSGSTTDAYYKEIQNTVTGVYDTIELHTDLSASPISIEVIKSEGIVDTNNENTSDITQLQSQYNVVTVTTTYQALLSDGLIRADATAGNFNITLPSVSAIPGLEITIKKIDTTVNIVTIVGNIDGISNTTLDTQSEVLHLQSNGTYWEIIDRKIPQIFSTAVATTVTGTTTNPTKGTVVTDEISYYRDGKFMVIHFNYDQSAGGAAGSGFYLVAIPGGYVADSAVQESNSSTTAQLVYSPGTLSGSILTHQGGASNPFVGVPVLHNTTHFKVAITSSATTSVWGSAQNSFGASLQISGWLRIPISGWNG